MAIISYQSERDRYISFKLVQRFCLNHIELKFLALYFTLTKFQTRTQSMRYGLVQIYLNRFNLHFRKYENIFIQPHSESLFEFVFRILQIHLTFVYRRTSRSKIQFGLILVAMMIPYQVTQVPLYILMVQKFSMTNTYAAMILPGLCTAYNIFLCKQFFSGLPTPLIESAKIEGCNQFQIFVKIVLPLAKTCLLYTSDAADE